MNSLLPGHSALEPSTQTSDPHRVMIHTGFALIRAQTMQLVEGLSVEDLNLQSMPDASPLKWHLAHTTWFFETFLLGPYSPGYQPLDPRYRELFNSYYQGVGERWPRPQRALLSRPSLGEVVQYRLHVDEAVRRFVQNASAADWQAGAPLLEIGLHHEQQHQELMLTDLKHAWSLNPLGPKYREMVPASLAPADAGPKTQWVELQPGLYEIGHAGPGFAFDNESKRHRVWLEGCRLAERLVSNAQYLRFIEDGGYQRPELWLSAGWETVQREGWQAPLYWRRGEQGWESFTLHGWRPLVGQEPVCHVSYFEADAYARWAGCRLPTEQEWEAAAACQPLTGWFVDSEHFHPASRPAPDDVGPFKQMFGDVWQWTASPYVAYPGYRPAAGALGEYNGKFMCDQWVLRGASCATPRTHARVTYRNFFPAAARWQFSGLRLAQDLE
jgi:ergothioneine biosynthesis protein EgtB